MISLKRSIANLPREKSVRVATEEKDCPIGSSFRLDPEPAESERVDYSLRLIDFLSLIANKPIESNAGIIVRGPAGCRA